MTVGSAVRLKAGLRLSALALAGLLLGGARAGTPDPVAGSLRDADPYPSTYRAPPSGPLVLTGATILDGTGGRVDDGDVVTANGTIVAVGQRLPRPAGATIIDARGKWITPGLIDPHTHLGTYTLPQTSLDADASDVTEMHSPDASRPGSNKPFVRRTRLSVMPWRAA